MDDPRRILETAADQRVACELHPRRGTWLHGRVLRVERGGVVLLASGLSNGEDVACWLTIDGVAYTFEASVLRVGVPVPDRSQDGVLLGFIDNWRRAERAPGTLSLDVLPATGGPVSLINGQVRVVELSPQEWVVTTPNSFHLVFVEQGSVRLRIGLPGSTPLELSARVNALSRGEGHILYSLRIERIDTPESYLQIIDGVRRLLGL